MKNEESVYVLLYPWSVFGFGGVHLKILDQYTNQWTWELSFVPWLKA